LGDLNNVNNGTFLRIDSINNKISTTDLNIENGLLLNFDGSVYQFGDYAGQNIETSITFDSSTSDTTIVTQRFLMNDSGANTLTSTSAGGNSGQNLIIYINGAEYKIQLLLP
jgi:glycosylphosphatidylinositol transamidase (GPIT) subunit GPI8